jgi:C4-dicarboxylate-specific signal transduction histidine kinase
LVLGAKLGKMNTPKNTDHGKFFIFVAGMLLGVIGLLLFFSRVQLHRQVFEAEAYFLRAQFEKSMNSLLLEELDLEDPWLSSKSLQQRLIAKAAVESLKIPQVLGVQAYDQSLQPLHLNTSVETDISTLSSFEQAIQESWISRKLPSDTFGLLVHLPDGKESYFIEFQLEDNSIRNAWDRIDSTLLKQGSLLCLSALFLLWIIFRALTRTIHAKEKLLLEKTEVLKKTNQQLTQAYKTTSLGALTGHLMHALNSPLTTLSSISKDQDFLSTESSREDTQQTIQKIHQLVRQALESLKEVEKGEISYCLSMKEVLETAAQKLDKTSPDTSLKILNHESLSGPVDNLQANLTLAILSNLFQNSAEAQTGAEIVLEGKRKGKNWELLISDNCGGIPPNLLPRIFSPVISPKPEGSGIGLALSKQLAESMEGSLQLQSSDSSGTRFKLIIPALDAETTN